MLLHCKNRVVILTHIGLRQLQQRMQFNKITLLRETQLFGGGSNRLVQICVLLLKWEKYVCKMIYLFTHCFADCQVAEKPYLFVMYSMNVLGVRAGATGPVGQVLT